MDTMDPSTTEIDRLRIAALLDTARFPWSVELIDFTVSLINNGWLGNILNGTELEYSISNAACDRHVAVQAFLDITRNGVLPNAILGCRCSSSSMAVATLAAADNIPMLSPAASDPDLSNQGDYPTFNRLVAPDNKSGQVGALVTLLRQFGWERILIINTNDQYAQAFKVELSRAWLGKQDGFTGQIGYEGTVQVGPDTDEVDSESVKHVLRNAPFDNPSMNSKVVVLLAHHQHAFPILKIAQETGFDPNTIYIGVDAWTGRSLEGFDKSWMPEIPGKPLGAPKYAGHETVLPAFSADLVSACAHSRIHWLGALPGLECPSVQ
jgi:ABC-type branched-subunit amino acid transport system substrate-binding protein